MGGGRVFFLSSLLCAFFLFCYQKILGLDQKTSDGLDVQSVSGGTTLPLNFNNKRSINVNAETLLIIQYNLDLVQLLRNSLRFWSGLGIALQCKRRTNY